MPLAESRLNVGLSSGSFLSFSFLSSLFIFANNFINCRRVWRREENDRVLEQNRTARMDCCHFVNSSFSSRIRLKFWLSSHSLAKNISLGVFAELGPLSLKTSGSLSFLWGPHRLLTACPGSELVGKQQECVGRLLVADNLPSCHWLRFHTFFLPWVFSAREFPFEK